MEFIKSETFGALFLTAMSFVLVFITGYPIGGAFKAQHLKELKMLRRKRQRERRKYQ